MVQRLGAGVYKACRNQEGIFEFLKMVPWFQGGGNTIAPPLEPDMKDVMSGTKS